MSRGIHFFKMRRPDTEEVKTEMKRRVFVRDRLLADFEKHKVLTTAQLRLYGTGVSSRIFELRQRGYRISAVYERPGHFKYIFRGKKQV